MCDSEYNITKIQIQLNHSKINNTFDDICLYMPRASYLRGLRRAELLANEAGGQPSRAGRWPQVGPSGLGGAGPGVCPSGLGPGCKGLGSG